jgi:hypothetical protein
MANFVTGPERASNAPLTQSIFDRRVKRLYGKKFKVQCDYENAGSSATCTCSQGHTKVTTARYVLTGTMGC